MTIDATSVGEKKYIQLYVPSNTDKFKFVHNKIKPDSNFLYFTCLTVNLLSVGCGGIWAWSSPAVPTLQSTDSRVNPLYAPITTIQISTLTGLPLLFSLIGTFLTAFASDIFGRKRVLQIFGLGLFICNTAVAFSTSIVHIIIFRCSSFISFGSVTLVPIYLLEVCEDHNRMKYGCLVGLTTSVGMLLTFIIGTLVSLRTLTLFISANFLLFLILPFFIPETPVYSLTKGRVEECMADLRKLRPNKSKNEIDTDFKTLEEHLLLSQENEKINCLALLKTKEVRMGLGFAFGSMLFQYTSGMLTIIPLTATIFNESGIILSGDNIGILVAVLQVLCVWATTFLIEKTGKKPLLVISSIGASITITVLGLYFYLKHVNSPVVGDIGMVAVASFLLYIFSYSIGLGPIPSALIGELFTSSIRATALSLVMSSMIILLCIISFAFPIVAEAIGNHWCFWLFGVNCFLGAIFFYTMLPETEGKSVTEVQEILKKFEFNIRRK